MKIYIPTIFVNARLSRCLLLVAGLLVLCLPGFAGAAAVTTLVAAKGDPGHFHLGGGNQGQGVLIAAGPAAVDAAGDVAVQATGGGPVSIGSAILLYSGTTRALVAHTGPDATNFSGPIFAKLSDPVLSGSGALAFIGTLKTGTNGVTGADDMGIFMFQSGTLNVIAMIKDAAPTGNNFPGTMNYSSFSQLMVNNAGGVTFEAGLKGPGVSTQGIFATDSSGTLRLLVAKGHGAQNLTPGFIGFVPLPLVGGQSRTVDTVNGNITLSGPLNPPFRGTIGLALSGTAGFSTMNLVNTTGTTPKGGAYKSFDEPIVNANGSVAFLSRVSGLTKSGVHLPDEKVIWLITGGTNIQKVARTGNNAPDTSGSDTAAIFAGLSDPVLDNNDRIAYIGTLQVGGTNGVSAATDTGIWVGAPDSGKRVAQKGDVAPDSNGAPGAGKLSSFLDLVLPDVGGPVFLATLNGVPRADNEGLFAVMKDGTLVRVVGKGDTNLPTRDGMPRTVKSIGVFQPAAEVMGQSRSFDASTGNLVYQANFTDGSWGIYEVAFP